MKIVVTHLTRMMKGYICVAGVDPDTLRHVRPVLEGRRLKSFSLDSRGGPFGMAAEVDLGPVRACGSPPEVEDVEFNPACARRLRTLAAGEFWALLEQIVAPDLRTAFGDDLRPTGGTCTVEVSQGIASLACLAPARPPLLAIDHVDRVRARIADPHATYDLPVTDLRFYEPPDYQQAREYLVEDFNTRAAAGARVLAGLGLTRPFAAREGEPERHWLQVNALYLQDPRLSKP